jgi:uncharacterized protein
MANLLEKLNEDIIKLTYEGNTVVKDVLKGLKCQLQLTQKKNGKDLTDEVEIDILKKEIKQKQLSVEDVRVQSKTEFVNKVNSEIEILSKYLPQYISVEETEVIITRVLAENQLSMKKDFKKAIELTMAGRDDIDKSIVSKLLQGKLV